MDHPRTPKIDRFACLWLIARFTDPALRELAPIVRGADTDWHDLAPQCPGLVANSLGLSLDFREDHEIPGYGMVI